MQEKDLNNLPEISFDEAAKLISENGATDRYSALGIPYPNPDTMCKGQCDGMGFYPCKNDDEITQQELVLWNKAHEESRDCQRGKCDGWHFIDCSECAGSGLAFKETEN